MGRGGTKFEGEAIGVRSGRIKKGVSAKDIKKEMEIYKKTGMHPALESNYSHILPTLPVRDQNRPHAFLSFSSGRTDLGRILIEVFEPELPTTCRLFLNRCAPGAQTTYRGTKITRVVQNHAMYGGLNPAFKGAQQRLNPQLRHVQSGLVSVSKSGDTFAITFEQALTLDESYQVVGRIHGEDSIKVLQQLNSTAVSSGDEPLNALRVADCGQTDYLGNYDPLLAGSRGRESAKEVQERFQQENAAARDSVGLALEEGFIGRPKLDKPVAAAKTKKKMLHSESDLSDSSSGSEVT